MLDLRGLDFIDSTGIEAICRAVENVDGTKLGIRRGPAEIERIIAMTGVDRLLPFLD